MNDFIPAIAHELRAPLTSVRALSEILHDNPNIDENRRQEFLGIILKETERLSRVVEHVLDIPDFSGMAQKI
jgi:signal transduction histidine kinase